MTVREPIEIIRKDSVVAVHVDDCSWVEMELPEEVYQGVGTKEDAMKKAKAILREWLHITLEGCDIEADDEEGYDAYTGTMDDDWSVISVHGNETLGDWMAICAPDRGEDVKFIFTM